jgi:hypothetical protein
LTVNNLEYLSELTALQHLNLRECKRITDRGLEYLNKLSALQHLDYG